MKTDELQEPDKALVKQLEELHKGYEYKYKSLGDREHEYQLGFDVYELVEFINAHAAAQRKEAELEARTDENAKWQVVAEEIVEKDGVYRAVNYLNKRLAHLRNQQEGK